MLLRILGCSGAEFPGHHPPALLLDQSLLFDAGTIGAVLSAEEQVRLSHIFITHSHLDHIRGIPLLADNILMRRAGHRVKIVGMPETIQALRKHFLNNIISPDFTVIPSAGTGVLQMTEIIPGTEFWVDDYCITAVPVNHAVPAVGYVVRRGDLGFLYTGDTGPTERIWQEANGISTVIAEVSFPNMEENLALLTGHLTPRLLLAELKKMERFPARILITHPKPQYYGQIEAELKTLGIPGVQLLKEKEVYDLHPSFADPVTRKPAPEKRRAEDRI